MIEYLLSFVKSLQINALAIDQYLKNTEEHQIIAILEKEAKYEVSIPQIDVELTKEMILDKVTGRWQSLKEWFMATEDQQSEVVRVFDTTNEIIRKITRYAARISELSNSGSNRREEYRKVAVLFLKCEDVQQAHRMSAMVFGLEKPYHLKGDLVRETDSMNLSVYEERPYEENEKRFHVRY